MPLTDQLKKKNKKTVFTYGHKNVLRQGSIDLSDTHYSVFVTISEKKIIASV